MYSKHKELAEKTAKQNEAEQQLETEADAAEEALNNSNPTTEKVELKEAA